METATFTNTEKENSIWVFNGARSQFSAGVFDDLNKAEKWIKENKLTGMLTKYPINKGVFDWANEKGYIKSEMFTTKKNDPIFVGGFTTASMEHYHYEDGNRE